MDFGQEHCPNPTGVDFLQFQFGGSLLRKFYQQCSLMPVNTSGEVKISDFGVSTILTEQTQANTQIGSTAYMSPERIRGEKHGAPSDVWSVGLTCAVCCAVILHSMPCLLLLPCFSQRFCGCLLWLLPDIGIPLWKASRKHQDGWENGLLRPTNNKQNKGK